MKKRTIYKWGAGLALIALSMSACTKKFEQLNTNPEISPETRPELLITAPQKAIVDRDFDWFYDNYQYLMRWTQFTVAAPTTATSGLFSPVNVNEFYKSLYNNIGRNLSQIGVLVSKMPEDQKASYQEIAAIAQVIKVYAAWRASDANGSIPYSQAWQARESELFTPVYDNQETLFATWDQELKAAINTLGQQAAGQVGFGNADIFYSGNARKWAKAANVLRMKLAMRLLKRAPAKVGPIVQEVLASPAGLFASNEEEWKFISNTTNFARGGNWDVDWSPSVGGKNVIDFMYDNADPRLPLFYEKNGYSPAVIDSLKKGGAFPSSVTYNPRQYVGLPASPDAKSNAAYTKLFSEKKYSVQSGGKTITAEFDTLSPVQRRLFDLNKEGNGSGQYTQPILTYAEMCFMLSELALRNIITDDAQSWYNKGITASVKAYDKMGSLAAILDYKAVEDAAIQAYLAKPLIAFTGTTAEKLEKIGVQNFLNHFKSPWEAWGTWKRLDAPKEGGLLPLEPLFSNGVKVAIPRRWALPEPNLLNQPNYLKAITEMTQTGEYGVDVNTFTGRVWWDKQ
ncbi:MAG TPA: SusD/RagB family nutrient-binding outer membrane lipoprotein [Chitinophaga sp.]